MRARSAPAVVTIATMLATVAIPMGSAHAADTGVLQICVHGAKAVLSADGPEQRTSGDPVRDGGCVMYSGDSAVVAGRYTVSASNVTVMSTKCGPEWIFKCAGNSGDSDRAAEIIVYHKNGDAPPTRSIVHQSKVTVDVDPSTPQDQHGTRVDFIFES